MFTENEIAAYKNIKAPEGLYKNIKAKKNKKRIPFYSACAAVACFVIFALTFTLGGGSNIVINGQPLKDSVVFYDTTSYLGRTVSSLVSVPVEIKATGKTTISVSHGLVSIDGSTPKKEVIITTSQIVWWEIDREHDGGLFEMSISDEKGVTKVTLEYEDAKITATKEKQK